MNDKGFKKQNDDKVINKNIINMSEEEFRELISPCRLDKAKESLEPIYNFEPNSKPNIVDGDNNIVGNYNHNQVILKLLEMLDKRDRAIEQKDKIIERKDALIEKLMNKL